MKQSSWRQYYLRRPQEIRRVFEQGTRHADAYFRVFFLKNQLPYSRFGVVVPRRSGKAVRRNRIKRVIREILRTLRPALAGGFDLVVLPGPRFPATDSALARRELDRLLTALGIKETANG